MIKMKRIATIMGKVTDAVEGIDDGVDINTSLYYMYLSKKKGKPLPIKRGDQVRIIVERKIKTRR